MKFSVIIPVYNVRDYLEDCVNSVIEQSISAYEIILVDDGSNDGSQRICDDYSSKYANIRTIHKDNGGQSSARNIGVESAQGDYFIFVDSDDYIAPNTLEMFDEKLESLGKIDVILSECMYNVEPDGTVRDLQTHLDISEYDGITGKQALTQMGMEWSPCGKCYRTDFWKSRGFHFIEGIISEDFQLIDRVTLEADKVAMVPAHYYYRWKIQSSTMHRNYGKLVKDTLFVIADWDIYLNERAYDSRLDSAIRTTIAKMLEHEVMGNVFYADYSLRNDLIKGINENIHYLKYDKSAEGFLIVNMIRMIGVKKTCFLLNKLKTMRKKRM